MPEGASATVAGSPSSRPLTGRTCAQTTKPAAPGRAGRSWSSATGGQRRAWPWRCWRRSCSPSLRSSWAPRTATEQPQPGGRRQAGSDPPASARGGHDGNRTPSPRSPRAATRSAADGLRGRGARDHGRPAPHRSSGRRLTAVWSQAGRDRARPRRSGVCPPAPRKQHDVLRGWVYLVCSIIRPGCRLRIGEPP